MEDQAMKLMQNTFKKRKIEKLYALVYYLYIFSIFVFLTAIIILKGNINNGDIIVNQLKDLFTKNYILYVVLKWLISFFIVSSFLFYIIKFIRDYENHKLLSTCKIITSTSGVILLFNYYFNCFFLNYTYLPIIILNIIILLNYIFTYISVKFNDKYNDFSKFILFTSVLFSIFTVFALMSNFYTRMLNNIEMISLVIFLLSQIYITLFLIVNINHERFIPFLSNITAGFKTLYTYETLSTILLPLISGVIAIYKQNSGFDLIFVISLFISLRSVGKPFYDFHTERKTIYEVINNDYAKKVKDSIVINPLYLNNGYQWDKNKVYMFSPLIEKCLYESSRNNEIWYMNVNPKKQQISAEARKCLANIVENKVKSGVIIFNNNLLGLASDLIIDENNKLTNVSVKKTDYYSYISTDKMIYKKMKSARNAGLELNGKIFSVNSENQLYNINRSLCTNTIGVSTLLITKDNKIIITKQGSKNEASANKLSPSGSGSVNFSDCYASKEEIKFNKKEYKKEKSIYKKYKSELKHMKKQLFHIEINKEILFKQINRYSEIIENKKASLELLKRNIKYVNNFIDVLKKAMVRELEEEVYTDEQKRTYLINNTYIIGYIRLLEHGGKPDFFGVTFIDEDAIDIERRFKEQKVNTNLKKVLYKNVKDINEIDELRLCSMDFKEMDYFKEMISPQVMYMIDLIKRLKGSNIDIYM